MAALVWFTLDLRLNDHPALNAAAAAHDSIIPLFILDDSDPWQAQGAACWWLHHSLYSLQEAITLRGGQLILRRGASAKILADFCHNHKVDTIYCSRAYEPWLDQQQRQLHQGLPIKRYGGRLLLEPDQITNGQGRAYQVFTPYYRHCRSHYEPASPVKIRKISWSTARYASEDLDDWHLQPNKPNWAKDFSTNWQPGEAGAVKKLRHAIDQVVEQYDSQRDIPHIEGTSRLSPHLHFGELSPRQVWHQIRQSPHLPDEQKEPFLRQLYWREFNSYLLHHWPSFPEQPFRKDFTQFPWRTSDEDLKAWQSGRTGYPIVDAGMRQLWQTGWMHNRVRMIVASFLCKHLRLPWQWGAQWFWQTLVDADLANNSGGWQWVAGCGVDAAPYFRIFNPILQGEKFDGDGNYIRQWVPELKDLPNKYIHKPWQAPDAILKQASVCLGKQYPQPIVDHQSARDAALAAYAQLRS